MLGVIALHYSHICLIAKMFVKLAVAVSLVASAAAHATFQELWINGVDQGSSCVRLPESNSPVTSVSTPVSLPAVFTFDLSVY